MTNEEYFNFVNDSTFITNLNQGNIIVPELTNLKQKFNPIQNISSIKNNQPRMQSNYTSFGEGNGTNK